MIYRWVSPLSGQEVEAGGKGMDLLASSQLVGIQRCRGCGENGAMVALHNQSETIERESQRMCLS